MAHILNIVFITTLVIVIGGGLGYLIWIKTRPKKMTWKAYVYQLGDGIIPSKIVDGKPTSIETKDLKPFMMDTLEKTEKDHGVEIYRLQKLNKTTPAVTSDCVDYWGQDRRYVNILLHEGNTTLLKKGYDTRGRILFNPMPYERMNMIQNEISIKKDRLKPTKDILERISPWVIAGILIIGLVAIGYFTIQGFVEISDNLGGAIEEFGKQYKEAAQLYKEAWNCKPVPDAIANSVNTGPPSIT